VEHVLSLAEVFMDKKNSWMKKDLFGFYDYRVNSS